MKKIFKVYRITQKNVCIPSNDYYRRSGDWNEENIFSFDFIEQFDTEEEAIQYINEILFSNEILLSDNSEDEYAILPVFTNK